MDDQKTGPSNVQKRTGPDERKPRCAQKGSDSSKRQSEVMGKDAIKQWGSDYGC
jgi:hypothetical protein